VSGEEIREIERLLARHGGGTFDGAAGPIRSIAARTSDLLGTAARVAELLHPQLQLGERVERLNLRLTLGIAGAAVDLARHAGGELTRGDYRRLTAARLCSCDEILTAEDAALLSCLDLDKKRLAIVRAAAERFAAARATAESAAPPTLAPYAA
jgi:helicase